MLHPMEKYLDGLEEILKSAKLSAKKPFNQAMVKQEKLIFQAFPYHNPNRHFVTWKRIAKQIIYQGELNEKGERDGRGITITSGFSMTVGNYKEGKLHGLGFSMAVDGIR